MRKPGLMAGPFLSYCFYFNGLSETKMPTLADLFSAGKWVWFVGIGGFWVEVLRFLGLDMRFLGGKGGSATADHLRDDKKGKNRTMALQRQNERNSRSSSE